MKDAISRRLLIQRAAGAAMLAAAGAAVRSRAAEPARLDVRDPLAVALAYVEDASKLDAAKTPKFVRGSNCSNCLQLQGKAGDPYRPCALFPGKLVAVGGWCSGWTPEM